MDLFHSSRVKVSLERLGGKKSILEVKCGNGRELLQQLQELVAWLYFCWKLVWVQRSESVLSDAFFGFCTCSCLNVAPFLEVVEHSADNANGRFWGNSQECGESWNWNSFNLPMTLYRTSVGISMFWVSLEFCFIIVWVVLYAEHILNMFESFFARTTRLEGDVRCDWHVANMQ